MTQTTSTNSLPCPVCNAPIELSTVQWCHCLSKALSVVCPSCSHCFCKLRDFPARVEWTAALRELRERQTAEKFRRALDASSETSPKRTRVLIVDDDEEIRLIAEYTVQQMGYETMTAAGAAEALSSLDRWRPDIVLTDALMPKIDGRDFCRLIKMADPSIRVVIMTSLYTSSRHRVEALNTFHADGYLAKPIDSRRLREILGQLAAKAA